MSTRATSILKVLNIAKYMSYLSSNNKTLNARLLAGVITGCSPVYIRQKRRDLKQIATEGFLGSSWSSECPH